MKINVSQAQSNWFVFKEAPAYKRGGADLHNPDMSSVKWVRQQLCTVMPWEFFLLYLSLFNVIPETEYLISWLQKKTLKQPVFD